MRLPPPRALADVLGGLLGREVTMTPSARTFSAADAARGVVAVYADDAGQTRAVLGWDLAAAAHAGTAFALIPPTISADIVNDRYLPTDIVESVYELSDLVASSLREGSDPDLRPDSTYQPAANAPAVILRLLYAHRTRLDLDLTVAGYGSGRVSLVVPG